MNENEQCKEPSRSMAGVGRRPSVAVAGIGGAGCNFVHRMSGLGVRGLTTIAVNTDRLHLELVDADKKLLIGNDRVHGTGAGADPGLGRVCMEEAADELAGLLGSPDVVFIVAGLGGGTGTGGAPAAARIAKEAGAIAVGVAFMPFRAERGRTETASSGLEQFRRSSDAVMVMENDRLLAMAPNVPIEQAFMSIDKLIVEKITGMIDMISLSSKIVETERILEALPQDGLAMVVCGDGKEAAEITCEVVDHPLLELECVAGASITASTVKGISEVMEAEAREGAYHMPRTNVLVGTRAGPAGSGRRVVPLVAGMKTYPAHLEQPRPRPEPKTASRGLRQLLLQEGPWTAIRPD